MPRVDLPGQRHQAARSAGTARLDRSLEGVPSRGRPGSDLFGLLIHNRRSGAAKLVRMIPRNGEFRLPESNRRRLLVHQTDAHSHTVDDGLRPGRTTGNAEIHWDDHFHRAKGRITVVPNAAAARTRTDRKGQLRGRHRFVSAPERKGGKKRKRKKGVGSQKRKGVKRCRFSVLTTQPLIPSFSAWSSTTDGSDASWFPSAAVARPIPASSSFPAANALPSALSSRRLCALFPASQASSPVS